MATSGDHRQRLRSRWPWYAATCYMAGLLLLVFTPISWGLNRLTVKLFVFWHFTLHNYADRTPPEFFGAVLNVGLFVPVGAIIRVLANRPWWLSSLLAVAISAAIELVQLLPALHRQASLGDVVANGVGGLVGVLLAEVWALVRRPRPGKSNKVEESRL